MDLWNAARAVVGARLSQVAPKAGLPCCALTGFVLLEMAGLPQLYGGPWWKQANVWDPAKPYSAVWSAFDLVGSPGSSPGTYPRLTAEGRQMISDILSDDVGAWYIVQGWRRLLPNGHADPQDLGSGHTFLMHIIGDGRCQVLESSRDRGVRFNRLLWYGGGQPEDFGSELIADRLSAYRAGVGLVRVETAVAHPTLVPDVMSSTPHGDEMLFTPSPDQIGLLDFIAAEALGLIELAKSGDLHILDGIESALDIGLKLAKVFIPGTVDDAVIDIVAGPAKDFILAALERAIGGRKDDAVALLDSAAQKRATAAAKRHQADTNSGLGNLVDGLLRKRAARLDRDAADLERRAADLQE